MTHPEAAFAKFVAANPAPHPEVLHGERPDVDEMLAEINGTIPVARPPLPASAWQRRGWAPAVAAFVLVVGIAAVLTWIGNPPEPSTTDPVAFVRRDALTKAEQWLQAVNEGEITRVMSMSSPDSAGISDRRVHEWVAGLAGQGMPVQVSSCEVTAATSEDALIECQIRLTDVVAVELGVTQLVAPFRYSDGLLAWQPYTGGDISDVNAAYSTYLREHHPAEYEMYCAPAAYEPGSVVQDGGLALTGACAELAAPLANEVVQWIRNGRPGS
jgi:hypothetical protein